MSAFPLYFLTTDRLGFRHWLPGDLPFAFAHWANPEVARWIGGPLSPERVEHRLRSEIALQKASGFQYWPLFL